MNELPPPRPRWVIVLISVAVLLILAAIIVTMVSGGVHGPGRHL